MSLAAATNHEGPEKIKPMISCHRLDRSVSSILYIHECSEFKTLRWHDKMKPTKKSSKKVGLERFPLFYSNDLYCILKPLTAPPRNIIIYQFQGGREGGSSRDLRLIQLSHYHPTNDNPTYKYLIRPVFTFRKFCVKTISQINKSIIIHSRIADSSTISFIN